MNGLFLLNTCIIIRNSNVKCGILKLVLLYGHGYAYSVHACIHMGDAVALWLPQIERSGFEPWLGSSCCVLGEELFTRSQCLSPHRNIHVNG